jgi:hypothetical protein
MELQLTPLEAFEYLQYWASGLVSDGELRLIFAADPEVGEIALLEVTLPNGDHVALEAFINDADGHIHLDTGLTEKDFASGQGGERPAGADLDHGMPALTLTRASGGQVDAGGLPSGERPDPRCKWHEVAHLKQTANCDACERCAGCGHRFCEWNCDTIKSASLRGPD